MGYIFSVEVVHKIRGLTIYLRYSVDITAGTTVIGIVAATIINIMAMTVIMMDTASHAAKIHLRTAFLLLQRRDRSRVQNVLDQHKLNLSSAPHVGRVWNRRHAKAAARNCTRCCVLPGLWGESLGVIDF